MVDTILAHPLVTKIILPFLLVFTLIFAVLDKTKILGDGKKQINAIIAFVIGLIFVSVAYAVNITNQIVVYLAVVAVVILVFSLLFGFASSSKEFTMPDGIKWTFGILIALGLIIVILIASGAWDKIAQTVSQGANSSILTNVIFIVFIIAAIVVVMWNSGNSKS